jgi:hypothetical protein
MIAESEAASIFRGTRGSRLIEISVPGAFTALGYSGQQKNPGASAAKRGLTKTEDKDTITSTAQADPLIPEEFLSKQAEPPLAALTRVSIEPNGCSIVGGHSGARSTSCQTRFQRRATPVSS